MPETVTWWKVPIIGVPGFQTCQVPKSETDLSECGGETLWVAGSLHICREHFPVVAEFCGDTTAAIEKAYADQF